MTTAMRYRIDGCSSVRDRLTYATRYAILHSMNTSDTTSMSDVERIMRQVGKRRTFPIRREDARPGMIFMSSHGYRLLITKVTDTATNRTEDRHVGIKGHIHADPKAQIRSERYPANSIIYIEDTGPRSLAATFYRGVLAELEDQERQRKVPNACPGCGACDCTPDTCPAYADWPEED